MIRAIPLIIFGLFIDGLQASISIAIAAIAAFPPATGAGVGCAAAGYFLGKIGCLIGGTALGLLSSIPFVSVAIASVTVPIGIALGFAINVCLSLTLGAGLVTFLWFNGMLYPKYLLNGIGEVMPGLNNIPFWTALVVLCLLRKNAEEGSGAMAAASGFLGLALSPGSALGKVAGGISLMKEDAAAIAQNAGAAPAPRREWLEQTEGDAQSDEERDATQTTRVIMNDIKPAKTTPGAGSALRAANDNKPSYATKLAA